VSVTGSTANVADASATISPSATLKELEAYLKAWSKLEGTPFSVNVEHDLPLANIDSSPHGLEERTPKDEWWLLPLSHLEYHEVDGDEVVSNLHGHIFGDA
jgi:hypothetical protein